MKIKVEKLTENKNTFRTLIQELDYLPYKPKVGSRLMITSSKNKSGGILTSYLTSVIETEYGYMIDTENPTYRITKMENDSENNTHTNNFV